MTIPSHLITSYALPDKISVMTESLAPAFSVNRLELTRLIACDTIVGKVAGHRLKYVVLLVPPAYAYVRRSEEIGPSRATSIEQAVRMAIAGPLIPPQYRDEAQPLRNGNPTYPLPDQRSVPCLFGAR